MRLSDMDLVSAAEAAEMLGVSKGRVIQLCQRDQLDAKKVGEAWVISRESVEERAKRKPSGGRPRASRCTGRFYLYDECVAEVWDAGDAYQEMRYPDGTYEPVSSSPVLMAAAHSDRSPYDLEYRKVAQR